MLHKSFPLCLFPKSQLAEQCLNQTNQLNFGKLPKPKHPKWQYLAPFHLVGAQSVSQSLNFIIKIYSPRALVLLGKLLLLLIYTMLIQICRRVAQHQLEIRYLQAKWQNSIEVSFNHCSVARPSDSLWSRDCSAPGFLSYTTSWSLLTNSCPLGRWYSESFPFPGINVCNHPNLHSHTYSSKIWI